MPPHGELELEGFLFSGSPHINRTPHDSKGRTEGRVEGNLIFRHAARHRGSSAYVWRAGLHHGSGGL